MSTLKQKKPKTGHGPTGTETLENETAPSAQPVLPLSNRHEAEKALCAAYEALGQPVPAIVWCESPLAVTAVVLHLAGVAGTWNSLSRRLRQRVPYRTGSGITTGWASVHAGANAAKRAFERIPVPLHPVQRREKAKRKPASPKAITEPACAARDEALWTGIRQCFVNCSLRRDDPALYDLPSYQEKLWPCLQRLLQHLPVSEEQVNAWPVYPDRDTREFWSYLKTFSVVATVTAGQRHIEIYQPGIVGFEWNAVRGGGPTDSIRRLFWSVLSHCYAVLPLAGVALLCEFPVEVHSDKHGLHRTDGPAVIWRDRWEIYSLGGIVVSADDVLHPDGINVRDIDREGNLERRRVLLAQYGTRRYLRAKGAEVVHHDSCGTLYRHEPTRGEAIVMVQVTNATPEPDGTFREYFLRVPPTMHTAREAVAWTFSLQSDVYAPSQES